jgi:hypothetical protein
MLKYSETNWKCKKGLQTRSYEVTFRRVITQKTLSEQRKRAERLSLVKILENKTVPLVDICQHLLKNVPHFHYNKNKLFHTTLLGFPSIHQTYYDVVTERISEFFEGMQKEMLVKFDLIRLGTEYEKNDVLKPDPGMSNGTLIAYGDSASNRAFTTYGNKLASFLIDDASLKIILGKEFRRKFPTVWCTMGYFTRDFMITSEIELLFNGYRILDKDQFRVPCYDLELGTSCYKDLRDWKRVKRFSLS